MLRTKVGVVLLATLILAAFGATGLTVSRSGANDLDPAHPIVVELFTSQSCYSCPPAEAYLGELVDRPGIIALEWHVDYWDDIVYGSAGQWVDPYSDGAYTARQRAYNQVLRGTGSVYTPQMVVAGRYEAVGSRRGDVEDVLIQAAAIQPTASVMVQPTGDGLGLAIEVAGETDGPSTVWLVRFLTERTTNVVRGENHGKQLANHHIVTAASRLGTWSGGPAGFVADGPDPGEGCAILVQPDAPGPIVAAALCPMAPAS